MKQTHGGSGRLRRVPVTSSQPGGAEPVDQAGVKPLAAVQAPVEPEETAVEAEEYEPEEYEAEEYAPEEYEEEYEEEGYPGEEEEAPPPPVKPRPAAAKSARTTRGAASKQPARASGGFGPVLLGLLIGGSFTLLILAIFVVVTKPSIKLPSFLGGPSAPTAVANNPGAGTNDQNAILTPATGLNPVPTKGPDLSVAPVGLFDAKGAGANRGEFNLPRGIAQDSAGNFYVSDTQNYRVEKFDKSGTFAAMFGSQGTGDGQFAPMSSDAVGTGPGGLAVDKDGNVYIADTWNHRIIKFDGNGKFVTSWGSFVNLADPAAATDTGKDSKFWGPRGVAIGPDGNVYVTDTGNKRVLIFDPSGKFVRKIDSGMTKDKIDAKYPFNNPGEMNEPIGIAVDKDGNVYVADTDNHRIQKFDKDGKPVAQWPVPEGTWAPAPYLEPFLALDPQGNVYATAPTGKTVLKFGPDGKLLGQKNKTDSVTLQTPTGIVVGADGTVYVVDTGASSVVNLGKIP